MKNKKEDISKILVSMIVITLILVTVFQVTGGLSSAQAVKIHPKDKILEVKIEKKMTFREIIETELVSLKIVGIAQMSDIDAYGDGFNLYPTVYKIATQIEYNGIKSDSEHQVESAVGIKMDAQEDSDTERISYEFLGDINFINIDVPTMTLTMVNVHIFGSFIYENDVATQDYTINSELLFDISSEIIDESGPPVLLSRHSTYSVV
jgi:hypothetical protein